MDKPLPEAKRKELVKERLADAKWLAEVRERLSSLGWFMKSLKEPLSRMVNKAEKCTGAFFEGRFKSIAVLDEEALLSVCAYILLLVDYTGRLLRDGKATVSSELASILDRIGSSADAWQARVSRLRGGRLLGRFIAGSREAMQRAAERLGVSHLANLKAATG